ncbi:MAG: aldo/keto reductase [Alphaproteobacteria bacterium]
MSISDKQTRTPTNRTIAGLGDVPALGLGCWAIGGPFHVPGEAGQPDIPLGYGNADDAESIRAIHAGLDHGIRLFDTANVYGAGHSEHILGQALKDRPDVLIATKLGVLFDESSQQVLGEITDASEVEPAIDASLARLQRDQLDLVQLHLNDANISLAVDIFEALQSSRQKGKIRSFGWSTDFSQSVTELLQKEPGLRDGFSCVQHAMNLFRDAGAMLDVVAENKLISLIRSPLAMGLLTGKFSSSTRLDDNDVRSNNLDWMAYFKDGVVVPEFLETLDSVRDCLTIEGRSLTQGAIGWIWGRSDRTIPLPGFRSTKQVEDSAGALQFGALPEAAMRDIDVLLGDKFKQTFAQAS